MNGEPLLFSSDGTSIQENKTKYRWVTEGPNCDVCNLMRGRVYALIVWHDTVMPGFHPCCDCRLEPVDEDTPESSLDVFGVEPWIDRVQVNTYTRWWLKRLMPWDVNMVQSLTEAFQQTGNWQEAFEQVERINRPNSLLSIPRLLIYNSQYPFPPYQSWFDDFFTSNFESPAYPSADLPYEVYR